MGLFGGGSSSSSSTSHTTSWLDQYLEPVIEDFMANYSGLNYENSTVAGITPAEQQALDRYAEGGAITTGQNIAKGGASLVSGALGGLEGLLEGNGKTQFTNGVTSIFNDLDGFMESQDSAIQDSVYSQMGAEFGSEAQTSMASTAVSGSSSADSARNAVLSSGANSMVEQESALAGKVLSGAIGLTGNAMSGEVGLLDELVKEGGNIFKAGGKMASTGEANQYKAGLFEQMYNQSVANNNRKNDMINNNMSLIDFSLLLDEVLPTANIDTTTTTNSKVKSSGGTGSALHSEIMGAAAMSALMFI